MYGVNMAKKSSAAAVPVTIPVQKETYHYLACDLGNAYSNIKSDNGVAVDWRSIMAPLSASTRLADWPIEHVIQYEEEWWASGEICYTLAPGTIEENLNMNRYTSTWYKRLFAFALHKAFYKEAGREIVYPRIISSVPAGIFKISQQVKAVQENLIGDYEIRNVYGGTLMVTVPKVILLPEGIGTYFGYLFGPGNNSQYQTGTWMVADFGYLTLDAVFMRDGEYIADMAKSDSQTGMSIVAEQIQEYVQAEAGVELDRAQIDKAMECDMIEVNRKPLNISTIRETALEKLGRRATGLLEQWSRRANLNGIIITGGGAKYQYPHIASDVLPPLSVAINPRRANADGAYLYITAE
jgi:hypothetical protein